VRPTGLHLPVAPYIDGQRASLSTEASGNAATPPSATFPSNPASDADPSPREAEATVPPQAATMIARHADQIARTHMPYLDVRTTSTPTGLTASDFASWGITTVTQAQTSFGGTGCNYVMTYSNQSGANVITEFLPGCGFDTDRTSTQRFSQANADGGGGGPDIRSFKDEPNLGDAAFYFLLANEDNVYVKHANLEIRVTSSVCQNMGCMGPMGEASTVAFAKLLVSRF
jgi:hypothetical protein